jgi:hypothetical protein
MKYVKLFENFISKYDLIKPLVDNGVMRIENKDESSSLQLELINMGYDWTKFKRTSLVKSERIYHIPNTSNATGQESYPLLICWIKEEMKITRAMISSFDTTIKLADNDPREIVEFNNYFKLKHEFRGHKLKKFGV